MFKKLRSLFASADNDSADKAGIFTVDVLPPMEVMCEGAGSLPLAPHLNMHRGLPLLDWTAVQSWVDGIAPEASQAQAWSAAEQAWLLHLKKSLGPGFTLRQSDGAALLSSLEENVAHATLEYLDRTRQRVVTVLGKVAEVSPWGRDILIVFDDEERYYDYVSHCYPDEGEFALSSGMFIDGGCGHFVTVKADLHSIEPVIAHELTHACLSHLPLPLWLNEGLAVNTEQRLTRKSSSGHTPMEMRGKHLSFWGVDEIQQFWSGESFGRSDDGNMLSYDLARIIVEQVSRDWDAFEAFVLAADWQDAGSAAAKKHLGIGLGEIAAALLEKPGDSEWEPIRQESES